MVRVVGLTTACGAGLSLPGGNGLVREPDGETAPLTQAGVVLGPARHPIPLLGDATAVGGISLEGHDGIFAREPDRSLRYPAPVTSSLIHATRRRYALEMNSNTKREQFKVRLKTAAGRTVRGIGVSTMYELKRHGLIVPANSTSVSTYYRLNTSPCSNQAGEINNSASQA
jgi:hypothetical protein